LPPRLIIAAGYRELHRSLFFLVRAVHQMLVGLSSGEMRSEGSYFSPPAPQACHRQYRRTPMQVLKRATSSVCFAIGFGVGTFIITITNALNAGFEAAERKYAKIP
jgi:hypothetical protein